MKKVVVYILAVIFSLPAYANNFRVADQIRLISAIHIASPWSTYVSDVWITNKSNDPVSISIIYGPANTTPSKITRRNVIKLAPKQHCEFIDILGAATSPSPQCKFLGAPLTTSGFGQIVFNACLDGANCEWEHTDSAGYYDPPLSVTKNYRDITVSSRIYSLTGAATQTVGQDLVGLPWWSYGDTEHPITVEGIRASSVFHTNFGLINGSDINTIVLTATLFDGATHTKRDEVDVTLRPFEARQQGITELFPLLGEWVRLNPTRAATNAYITVKAKGPNNGFFAYGSLIDTKSGDATTLEAEFDSPLSDVQIANLFGMGSAVQQATTTSSQSKGLTPLAASATSTPINLPPCSVIGPRKDGSYEALIHRGNQMVPWVTGVTADKAAILRVDCKNLALGFGKSDLKSTLK